MSFRTNPFFFNGLVRESHLLGRLAVPGMTLSETAVDKFCQSGASVRRLANCPLGARSALLLRCSDSAPVSARSRFELA